MMRIWKVTLALGLLFVGAFCSRGAVQFTSGSSQALVHTNLATASDYPWSISCWIKLNSFPTTVRAITIGGGNAKHALLIQSSTNISASSTTSAGGGSSATLTPSMTGLQAGEWRHVVCLFLADNDRQIFMDGVAIWTNSVVSRDVNSDELTRITFGCGMSGTGGTLTEYLNGALDMVGIWNRQLTTNEMVMLGMGYPPKVVKPDGLISEPDLLQAETYNHNFTGAQMVAINAPTTASDGPVRRGR